MWKLLCFALGALVAASPAAAMAEALTCGITMYREADGVTKPLPGGQKFVTRISADWSEVNSCAPSGECITYADLAWQEVTDPSPRFAASLGTGDFLNTYLVPPDDEHPWLIGVYTVEGTHSMFGTCTGD